MLFIFRCLQWSFALTLIEDKIIHLMSMKHWHHLHRPLQVTDIYEIRKQRKNHTSWNLIRSISRHFKLKLSIKVKMFCFHVCPNKGVWSFDLRCLCTHDESDQKNVNKHKDEEMSFATRCIVCLIITSMEMNSTPSEH